MMKKTLFFLVAMLFMSPIFADVYKWKDANGRIHYGDTLPIADTAIVRTDKQTDDQIANGEEIRAEIENSTRQNAMNEARDSAKSSGLKMHNVRVVLEGPASEARIDSGRH
jgi:hypothetical protein